MKERYVKGIYQILLGLSLILIFSMPAKAEEKTTQNTKSKVVRVACGMNDALYLDANGDPAGSGLYYIRQLAWNNNWTVKYVEGSYSESLENLYNGKVDLMFPVGDDDDSKNQLLYSKFIGGYQQIGLFARDDDEIFYDDFKGFDGKKVGLSIGSNSRILDDYAKKNKFGYKKVGLNTIQDKVKALQNGDVDLVAFSTLNTVEGGKLVAVLDQIPFYFCTNKKNQALMDEVNAGMSEIMINTPDIASTMYENVLKGYNTTSLTKAEYEKIKSTDKVTFGVYSDLLPLAGINSKGECVGIYVDLLKEIEVQSGLNIEIKPIKDSNKLYSYMDDGTVDFVIGIQELRFYSENADNYLASNGITDYTTVAVTMPDYQFADVKNPTIALTKSRNYLENYIYTNYPSAKITYYDTRKECLNAVRRGDEDATFLNTWEYNYESKNPRFQDMMEWESIRINSVVGLGGTRQSDLELLSILEKTISQISSEKVSDIIATNLNMPYDSYDFEDKVYEMQTPLLLAGCVILLFLICFAVYLNIKRKYIQSLVVANKTKADFLSRMSHELRTPLNAIQGYATLTSDHVSQGVIQPEVVEENMESIQKSSDYLLGIIKDILDVQQMETGKITLGKNEINPTEYMNTIVKMIQPMADEKGVKFSYNMINGSKNNYVLDGQRVQQILLNILYNAVKFTPEGGSVMMRSDIVTKDDEFATIRFAVEDTGIGMSEEFVREKLFTKFAQENQDITSPYSGCGNGLALCKELLELMDGEITCQSEKGKGTTFTVIIKTEYRKLQRKRRERNGTSYDLGGVKVLMCEDNPMNQEMEKALLERMNCKVEIANDGKEGLERFRDSEEEYYDIVLMDIRMPNMDGLEATREIRALPREDAKKVPILAVSANAFEEDVEKSLAAGMNEHLAKPVGGVLLYNKIKGYCRQEMNCG